MPTDRTAEPNEAFRGFYKVIAPLIMAEGVGDGQTTACLVAQAATIDALRNCARTVYLDLFRELAAMKEIAP